MNEQMMNDFENFLDNKVKEMSEQEKAEMMAEFERFIDHAE